MEKKTYYPAKTLSELKKVALINRDLETLRKIVNYEKRPTIYYFIREDETTIYDRNGIVVSEQQIPKDSYCLDLHVFEISSGAVVHLSPVKDTDLHREVEGASREKRMKFLILEVAQDFTFPVPAKFNWCKYCYDLTQKDGKNRRDSDPSRVFKKYRGW